MALLPRWDDEFAGDTAFQTSLLPAAKTRSGLLGMLANPALRQMLMGASKSLLEAGAPSLTPKGTGFGAALGAGIQGANTGYQSYEEQLAAQAAENLKRLMEERKLALEEQRASKERQASYGKWAGVALNPDSGKYEIVQMSDTGERIFSGVEADPRMKFLDTGSGFQVANLRTGQTGPVVASKELPPEKRPENVQAAAEAQGRGQAVGEAEGNKLATAEKAPEAVYILGNLTKALSKLPESPMEMDIENFKSYFTGGDKEIQDALGAASLWSGQMIQYVQKLPGASTDREFPVFMASAGIATDESKPVQRRIAAAQEAKKYFESITQRAQKGAGKSKPQASGGEIVYRRDPKTGKMVRSQ